MKRRGNAAAQTQRRAVLVSFSRARYHDAEKAFRVNYLTPHIHRTIVRGSIVRATRGWRNRPGSVDGHNGVRLDLDHRLRAASNARTHHRDEPSVQAADDRVGA